MSNYRRLISYIYAYEGGIKGKNIGFAKIEARSGQCKIFVNVKKVYVGNSDMGVYLLAGSDQILIGKIFIRNGAGEFRTAVLMDDVEGSGWSMDRCFGLSVHGTEDSWQAYTTIWEDAVAQAAELQPEQEEQQLSGQSPEQERSGAGLPGRQPGGAEQQPGQQPSCDAVVHTAQVDLAELTAESLEEAAMKRTPEAVIPEEPAKAEPSGHKSSIVEEIEAEIQAQSRAEELERLDTEVAAELTPGLPFMAPPEPGMELGAPQELPSGMESGTPQEQPPGMESGSPQMENRDILDRLEQEERDAGQSGRLWQHFKKTYPKIQAFDYVNGCEILTVKPQDIGLLPRETWTYGNNSFLLHGYYSYRYLILARLNNPQGAPRYLLGIPGHYYSNEKYMASMFGFPNFVLSKMQPAGDVRFGYWYTDINMGNQ